MDTKELYSIMKELASALDGVSENYQKAGDIKLANLYGYTAMLAHRVHEYIDADENDGFESLTYYTDEIINLQKQTADTEALKKRTAEREAEIANLIKNCES